MNKLIVALITLAALPALAQSATLGDACAAASDCVPGLRCKGGLCAAPAVSYATYKTLHLIAVLTVFLSLGGAIFLSFVGSDDKKARRVAMILHGVGMLVILVGGFGLMARLNFDHGAAWPLWIKFKFALWFLIGGFVILPRRLPSWNRKLWPIGLVLGGLAAWVAVHKPL